jgi:ADP-heptose:LPS heptosyltransferase
MVQHEPLIPEALLSRSRKILFITHLAIGDFTYLQSFFRLFSEKYPHIKIDLWVDEVRRTRLFWQWKHLKNYVLFDWLKESGLFNKIYGGTYSWRRFNQKINLAKKEEYPIVVSLCIVRSDFYTKIARRISKKGFVCAILKKRKKRNCCCGVEHVTDIYEKWFSEIFGITAAPDKVAPFISIPKKWISYAKLKFAKWGIKPKVSRFEKVIFINSFAKNVTRCWPVDRLVRLIFSLREEELFQDAYFIVNVEPRFEKQIRAFLSNYCLHRVILFTADHNFFQLPAVISLCDLVVSVETSIIHIASALKIPVVALMRRKNPEWRPFDTKNSRVVLAPDRSGWVEDIPLQMVDDEVRSFMRSL